MGKMNAGDRNFAERLVQEVQKRKIIYDIRHHKHKDRYCVDQAWREIAQVMGSKMEIVKRRWQNLRGSYSKSLSAKFKPGSVNGITNKGNFYLFDQMSFLQSHMHVQSSNSFLMMTEEDILTETEYTLTETDGQDETGYTLTEVANTPVETEDIVSGAASPESAFESSLSVPQSKKRKIETKSYDEVQRWNENTSPYILSTESAINPDLEFLKGLVPQVGELSRTNKRTFFREVSQLLFQLLDEQDQEEEVAASLLSS